MREWEIARRSFLADTIWNKAAIKWLAADASFRRYARIGKAGQNAILMDAHLEKENVEAFIRVAQLLSEAGVSTPKILKADYKNGFVLLEDFGDQTFTRLLKHGANVENLYDLAIDNLIQIRRGFSAQPTGIPDFSPSLRAEQLSIVFDWLWPEILPSGPSPEQRDEFIDLWRTALKEAPNLGIGLVHRDFHVDNLMRLHDGACGVLDFQDAAWGPLAYDLASLIEDARRPLEPEIRARCIDRYQAAFPHLSSEEISAAIAVHGGQRHMRVAALWVRLFRRDKKPDYLQHMQHTWKLLEASLSHPLLSDVSNYLDRNIPKDARERAKLLGETIK